MTERIDHDESGACNHVTVVRQKIIKTPLTKQVVRAILESQPRGLEVTDSGWGGEGSYDLFHVSSDRDGGHAGMTIWVSVDERRSGGTEVVITGVATVDGTRSRLLRRSLGWILGYAVKGAARKLRRALARGLSDNAGLGEVEPGLG